jgi:hypothetical protein
MPPKLTDEMRHALAAHPGGAIPVCDEQSQQVYVLVPRDEYARLQDDHVRRELQVAFDQADRGEWRDLDIESIIARAQAGNSAAPGASG